MTMFDSIFLPGVPADLVHAALSRAGGNEIESGKLGSPESSAALAVNGFGYFMERPADLPPFSAAADIDWPAIRVDVERQMRFPWAGGRHPWLDAAIETETHLLGVESKRFEPFRDRKVVNLSEAYDRDVWGDRMGAFIAMRDALRAGTTTYERLDAAQLIKHAFGLVTEGHRLGKAPVLVYLYAEPTRRGESVIPPRAIAKHREEVAHFAAVVKGAEVRFVSSSWREWLEGWDKSARDHANALIARFQV